MEYKVDGWNNFCRVFEFPEKYPEGYCFDGGIAVKILMVDWFNPVAGVDQPGVTKEVWEREVGEIKTKNVSGDDVREYLIPFLQEKSYVLPDRKYLVMCDFGLVFAFEGEKL